MATSTFFEKIIISKEAAEIMAVEAEKEREPHVPELDMKEVERSAQAWLKEYRLKKSLAQKKK